MLLSRRAKSQLGNSQFVPIQVKKDNPQHRIISFIVIPVMANFCRICLRIAKACWDGTCVYTERKTLSSNHSSVPALPNARSLAGHPHDYMDKTEQQNLDSFSHRVACPLLGATWSLSAPQGQCETVSATVKLSHNFPLSTFFIFPHPYYFCQASLTRHDISGCPKLPVVGSCGC